MKRSRRGGGGCRGERERKKVGYLGTSSDYLGTGIDSLGTGGEINSKIIGARRWGLFFHPFLFWTPVCGFWCDRGVGEKVVPNVEDSNKVKGIILQLEGRRSFSHGELSRRPASAWSCSIMAISNELT